MFYQCFQGEWLASLSGWTKATDNLGRIWCCRVLPHERGNVTEPDDFASIEAQFTHARQTGRMKEVAFYAETQEVLRETLSTYVD